ncbi:MAG: TonB-dependent receptor [Bacteroidales bacterium]|nr:TonB-dependent receptor [Bacteroidales bacterium]
MRFSSRIAIILLTFLTGALPAGAQKAVLSGYVKDASSGEPLIGAVVFTEDLKAGVSTNNYGFYSLQVDRREQVIKCSYAGYVTAGVTLNLQGPLKYDFELKEDREMLEAAKVFSTSKREQLVLPQMGKESVTGDIIRKLPALMGEADVIRVIQMMPGVQTPSEGSTGFSVRGGGIDQNLVLMDGAPLYNSGHFLGFMSMFNGDAVKNAHLYKGDFPATFGGRLSSVLEVNTRDGSNSVYKGNLSVGLITAKASVEGPVIKDKLSFMLAGRRTYMDMFFPLFGESMPKNTQMFFYDMNAKLSWIAGPKDRVYLSAFSGRDIFGMSMEAFDLDLMKFSFANNTQTLHWSHEFSPKVFFNTSLYNSRYNAGLDCEMSSTSFNYLTVIRESGLKYGITWYINPSNTVQAGINLAFYRMDPGDVTPSGEESIVQALHMPQSYGIMPSVYLQNEQKAGPLTLRYGFRVSSFSSLGKAEQRYYDPDTHELTETVEFGKGERIKTYTRFEPRASASLSITPDFSLKASYARSYQYIQQVPISVSGTPVDAWFMASPNVLPQCSDQFSAGFNSLFVNQALEFSAEAFYKNNKNTMDFKENPGFIFDDVNREGLLRFGKSWSYGTEFMLRYDFARLGGWLSYTWSRAMYDIPELNGGKIYRSPLNHEHSINFVLSYDISKRLALSTDWVFYSGAPTTFPVGRFVYGGSSSSIYSSRNDDTMPNYHRMDLSVTYKSRRRVENKHWGSEWNLSLYNAYSRHNAWSLAFLYDESESRPKAMKVYLFTLIPSLSYNVYF